MAGAQGAAGQRGAAGAQGAQGPKGAQGARGEYGYNGDDGEIGYQGITGDEGAIWHDGIRLNGYNTHLFVYDQTTQEFMPVGGQNNILRIEDGTTIRVWLDRDAYNSIYNNNSKIVIQELSGGAMVTTNYPAYYSENIYITDRIKPDVDLNGIVDFTFVDGSWYYSGGLISVEDLAVQDAIVEYDSENDALIVVRSGKLNSSSLQVIEAYIDNFDCGEY